MEHKDLGKTSTGMEPNLEAALSYLLWFFTGIIFYVLEKENKFVRFHAMQSIVTFGFFFVAVSVLGFIPIIGWLFSMLLWLASLAIWVLMMMKAYQGEEFKLPVAGDIAQKNS